MKDISVCVVVFVEVVDDDECGSVVVGNVVLFFAGTEVVVVEEVFVDTEV